MDKIKYHYFKTKKERHEYLGVRYFRINYNDEGALQICFSAGDVKKGKANNFGVYYISKVTFFQNYLAMAYVEPIQKNEFDKKFNQIIEAIK